MQVTLMRAVAGLFVGAVSGTVLVVAYALVDGLQATHYSAPDFGSLYVILIAATIVWTLGLLVIAPLPWWLLHAAGSRSWLTAIALGFVLTFVVVLAALTHGFGLSIEEPFSVRDFGGATWLDGKLTPHGWQEALTGAYMCALAGAIVGYVVWKVAYRKTD